MASDDLGTLLAEYNVDLVGLRQVEKGRGTFEVFDTMGKRFIVERENRDWRVFRPIEGEDKAAVLKQLRDYLGPF
jgi:hypothetical protein